MSFVWARASAYLLTREGFGSLSNYVAVIADPRNKVFAHRLMKSGFVDRALRYNVQSFGTMCLSDVLGVLRLSSFCIEADDADGQERWRTASWYISVPFAMQRLRELISAANDYDEMQCLDVIVALTRLRKTMAVCVQPVIPGHTNLRDEPGTDVQAHPRIGQPGVGTHAYPPTTHSSQHPSALSTLLGRIKAFVHRDRSTVQSRDSPLPPRRSVQIGIPQVQFNDFMACIDSLESFNLLPLYSGRDPSTHLIEANMFTLVAHVLAMPVKSLQRDGGIIYALLQRELNIEEYIHSLERERRNFEQVPTRSTERQGGPPASPEFLNVLQKLGLNTWVQPGSPFAVYDAHITYRMLLKGPLAWLANALEELAHRVTFDPASLPAQTNPPAFPVPSIPESEQPAAFETYGYSPIWRASHAASGTSGAPTTPLNGALPFPASPQDAIAHGAANWTSRASGFSQAPSVVRSDEGTVLAASERNPEP
ncbi:hypothetical protein PENSPDRAFT_665968 [Peniophora sp. CONT]|nr:hypothetical protein PENSPDRAFT_665968 [Peniophora sp. CONT]